MHARSLVWFATVRIWLSLRATDHKRVLKKWMAIPESYRSHSLDPITWVSTRSATNRPDNVKKRLKLAMRLEDTRCMICLVWASVLDSGPKTPRNKISAMCLQHCLSLSKTELKSIHWPNTPSLLHAMLNRQLPLSHFCPILLHAHDVYEGELFSHPELASFAFNALRGTRAQHCLSHVEAGQLETKAHVKLFELARPPKFDRYAWRWSCQVNIVILPGTQDFIGHRPIETNSILTRSATEPARKFTDYIFILTIAYNSETKRITGIWKSFSILHYPKEPQYSKSSLHNLHVITKCQLGNVEQVKRGNRNGKWARYYWFINCTTWPYDESDKRRQICWTKRSFDATSTNTTTTTEKRSTDR